MIYNTDVSLIESLVAVLEKVYHIVDLLAKGIYYYNMKYIVSKLSRQEKIKKPRRLRNRLLSSLIKNISIISHVKKHYKNKLISHLMREQLLLRESSLVRSYLHQSSLTYIRNIKLERRK